MTEQAKVPAIRFAGFTDPWEQRKLGELYEKNDERNTFGLGAERTLSIATMTFNSEGNGADASSLPNYKVIRVGDAAFEGHSNKSFAYGRFVVNAVADGIMSPRFSCLRPKNSYPVRFWKYYIHSEQVMRDILVRATKSGTMMNELVIDDLFKQSIAVPQEAEQQAIGYFFSHLDTLITLHQRKYDKLVVFKKSMLEKMFPKDGESVPEIRFAGFTDPWEQRKLGDIASFSKGSGYSKADIRESGIPLFLYGRMYTQYETRVDSVDTFAAPRPGTLYSKGTEIVVPASGESAEDIARASAITREGIALGGDLNVVYPQRMVTPLFLAYGLSHGSSQKLLAQKAQGKTVVHIHASDLKGLGIAFPDVTEQQAIGTFFSSLDDLITLHQRKLELLRNIKKSLLDKMFV